MLNFRNVQPRWLLFGKWSDMLRRTCFSWSYKFEQIQKSNQTSWFFKSEYKDFLMYRADLGKPEVFVSCDSIQAKGSQGLVQGGPNITKKILPKTFGDIGKFGYMETEIIFCVQKWKRVGGRNDVIWITDPQSTEPKYLNDTNNARF